MTEFDPDEGSLPDQDHDHDVLLIAGSRPEVARLAPVATAFASADRIRALTVATGPDPMAVHEAFEALGVPADVTRMPGPITGGHPAAIGSMLMTNLDGLLVDLDPSAIMVYGGGMTAAIAAQVAFWRQIPVVHLQAGVASDDLLCPFPQEANRRIIGQLASLFLTTGGAALGSPIGPNAIPVGDTMAANPQPADLRFARLLRRVRTDGPRLVLVGLDRPDSLGVLAGLPDLLEREPDIEVVLYGELAGHGAAAPIADHPRATVVRNLPLAELVGLIAASAVLVSDDPELVTDAPGLGTPAVLVDGPHIPEPGDSIRSILSPAVMTTIRQVLAARVSPPAEPSDGLEAARVEQAVAWMFGLSNSPTLGGPLPGQAEEASETEHEERRQ
ncbi:MULTISPECIES: UDP-N-acetylglucosamine 2-epimerase [unclassified Pseudonocardia]|jgi:UDP-N-acetylglucosamine 2-epimerase (non-hydrolysing)|uniref:UDP-N-acetylglucosamine 2-epimerase n=1 Tax=unclassified Pseudonocardia TaxID=2619320 RepID=UPI00095C9485|nr:MULTISPECIES: UDP-N-acetylglucosamine 2-epimerase [unclassified Pseudonocardia]MBN9098847.1 UDP-N-acetylglucosamine 2-epimerase [Pseudonocardia sp.]OJY40959.1 MAG: UDP-N-acetylglucosamine 2-epimerase [Pseudonocardia sp. 73-21]